MNRAPQITHNLLRIVAGLFFLMHGGQKLLGWFAGPEGPGSGPPVGSLIWIAGVLELVGGSAMVLGLFTRPIAFLLSGEMAVAYFKQHLPHGLWPLQNHGEAAALFCFIWLYFAATGPGSFSLDHVLFRKEGRIRDGNQGHVGRTVHATARR